MKKIIMATVVSISVILTGCNNFIKANSIDGANSKITIEEAKEIALKKSNLSSEEVSFIRADIEIDDGVEKYNIEFYHGNKEYDYEINAADGKIIEYDFDVENYNSYQEQGNNEGLSEITVEEAKKIALNHANFTSDEVNFKKIELDMDDGVKQYNVEFYHNNKEYNYEIDANTGEILSYELD